MQFKVTDPNASIIKPSDVGIDGYVITGLSRDETKAMIALTRFCAVQNGNSWKPFPLVDFAKFCMEQQDLGNAHRIGRACRGCCFTAVNDGVVHVSSRFPGTAYAKFNSAHTLEEMNGELGDAFNQFVAANPAYKFSQPPVPDAGAEATGDGTGDDTED